ncbi:MAG: bifunctional hydroxymethylpyrimidine kinase/phosphomethylpyrimidine kinase [Lautropia sp.]|nr:bifunctional hydroxymethylpyrimidine kinase/phosphomethylpyrimidine kinase [Lautropia sp.]
MAENPPPNVLSIAGTDPTGGAGIQADLKTFGALGAYGMAVITAVVAQNTRSVTRISALSPDLVRAQLDAVFTDVTVSAVKIGMVANAGIAQCIADTLAHYRPRFVVYDPVMVSSTNHHLMNENDLNRIRRCLLPHVSLLTPNLSEAARLLNSPVPATEAAMQDCLSGLHSLGVANVLLKGGHLGEDKTSYPVAARPDAIDLLSTPEGILRLSAPRLTTRHGHGTGCTLSSAIAALWPEHGLAESCLRAKQYVHGALQHADLLDVGHGRGPLHHFWQAVHLPGQLAYHAD